jgi:hypothetical protein
MSASSRHENDASLEPEGQVFVERIAQIGDT